MNIAFNGHAHVYERNLPSAPGLPGHLHHGRRRRHAGADRAVPRVRCLRPRLVADEAEGDEVAAARHTPTSATQVFHFIKVTVAGTTVTVAPTDELGRTFDVQTYSFASAIADTVIDSGAGEPVELGLGDVQLPLDDHAGDVRLRARRRGRRRRARARSPTRGLADGATPSRSPRPPPRAPIRPPPSARGRSTRPHRRCRRRSSPRRSARAPSASPGAASSDAGGVAGYDVSRDGVVIGSAGADQTSFSDTTAAPTTTYQYAVRARDAAGQRLGHSSTACGDDTGRRAALPRTASRPGSPAGRRPAASRCRGRRVHSGGFAAEGNTDERRHLREEDASRPCATATRASAFNLKSDASQVNLLRMRATGSVSLGYAFVTATGQLGMRNDVPRRPRRSSSTVLGPGWHALELHLLVNGRRASARSGSTGRSVADLSSALTNLGTVADHRVPDRRGPDRAHLRRRLRRRGLRDAAPRAVKVWSRALTHAPVAPDELLGRV